MSEVPLYLQLQSLMVKAKDAVASTAAGRAHLGREHKVMGDVSSQLRLNGWISLPCRRIPVKQTFLSAGESQ
jgi:hypothetical protein